MTLHQTESPIPLIVTKPTPVLLERIAINLSIKITACFSDLTISQICLFVRTSVTYM